MSTRNRHDTYTAYRALHDDYAPDGGLFAPYRLPVFTAAELRELLALNFGSRIAKILNQFFPAALTGWDVDFAIGRNPLKLVQMSHKLYIAELWHNLESDFSFLECALFKKLLPDHTDIKTPAKWVRVAIRIAALFAIYGELAACNVRKCDFSGIAGDYAFISAVVYAKKMGLPIGKIICASDENGGVWDLFQKGEMSFCVGDKRTNPSSGNACAADYRELLIFEIFGTEEAQRYAAALERMETYQMGEEQLSQLNQWMDGTVISRSRCLSLIRSIFRTHSYVSDPFTALTYGGLMDHRAINGESYAVLLISEVSPRGFGSTVTDAIGISETELRKYISK